MLGLIFLLVIAPACLGLFFKDHILSQKEGFSPFFFVMGFLTMLAQFALVCYPATYFDLPFHRVCLFVCVLYCVECLGIIIARLIKNGFPFRAKFNTEPVRALIRSPFFWIMVAICAFQIIRLFSLQPYQMRDSRVYNGLINDIVQTDRLYRKNRVTGQILESLTGARLKTLLSPWYPFLSMIAKVSGYHALIIINTVMPSYVLLMHYLVFYDLGYYLFDHKAGDACLFTALCAFLHEITLSFNAPTMILLMWPVWGKGILAVILIPAILVLYLLYLEQAGKGNSIFIFTALVLMVIAGCSVSTMASLTIPIEIGILGIIQVFRQHSIRPVLYSICACIPVGVYLSFYVYLSHLQH